MDFRRGFTLLELCIVLMVLSVMIGGIMSAVTITIRQEQQTTLRKRIAAIQDALLQFRLLNNRLPCPGNLTYSFTDANFGRESANPGSCTGGTPAVNYTDPANILHFGSVPVRTLNLPDEYAFDPWGNKFTFAVLRAMTGNNAFTTYDVDYAMSAITILDGESNVRTAEAIVVLVSHGANGHGAYQITGTVKTTGSSDADELNNCSCNSSGTAVAADTVFVQKSPAGTVSLERYDDNVDYMSRADLASTSERTTEGLQTGY